MEKNKKTPQRRCIGCGNSFDQKDLVRFAYYEGELSLDITGRKKGRGVYLCKNPECHSAALKKSAFQRSFKRDFDREMLKAMLEEAFGAEN